MSATRPALSPEAFARLQDTLRADAAALRERDGLPGLSAAFVLPDGAVGTAAVGWADQDARVRMGPDTRFLAGSVGKSFHAALAVDLAREPAGSSPPSRRRASGAPERVSWQARVRRATPASREGAS